ncbi:MAG: DoxX family protein [Prevotellaceae bacterium]|jgi:putative oxidoreductase|nr:DoxX family protein [Prevotellaceae bacterium]
MYKMISFIVSPKATGYNRVILFIRIFWGLLMITHGLTKLNHFDELATNFLDPVGLGSRLSLIMIISAEIVCSIFLIFGLFTRIAVIPLLFSMMIAIFIAHAADPFAKKELAVIYAVIYALLLFTGGGKFSLDNMLYKKIFSKK